MKSFGTSSENQKTPGMTHLNTDLISSVFYPDYEPQQHQPSSRARHQPKNPNGPIPPISSRLDLKQKLQGSTSRGGHHMQSTTSSAGGAAQEILMRSRRGSQVASTKGQQYIVSARKEMKRATSSGGRSRMQSATGSYKTSRNCSFRHAASRTMGSLSRDRSQLGCGLKSSDNQTLIYPTELKPQIMLFKLFSARTNLYTKQSQVTQLALNLPDTLVFNDASGIPNFWIQKLKGDGGIPFRRSELNRELIIKSFLGKPFDPERDRYSSLDVIAVLKTFDETQTSCKTNLITRAEFEKVYDEIARQKEKPACIQRYIKPKGSIATKVRVVYNKNKTVQFTNYIITNHEAMFEPLLTKFDQESVNRVKEQLNQAYLIDINSPDISIVKSVPGTNKQADQTQIQVQTLLAYLETTCNLHFNSLVVDFIKDYDIFQSTETWHLTGIISYHLDPSAMSHVQLCLFPFTLNPHDDLRHFQPTLPLHSAKQDAGPSSQPPLLRPSSSRQSLQPSNKKYLTDKQCGLCDLLYHKDRVGNMVPKALIDTVREWVNQRLNKEVFQSQAALKRDQGTKKGQENANPNGAAQVGVCKDCSILFKRAMKSLQVAKLIQSKLHMTKTPLVGETACRIFIYFSEIEDQRLAQCEKIIRNIEYQILSEPSVSIEVGKAQEIPNNKSMCNLRPVKVLKAHQFTALGEAEGRQRALEIIKAIRVSITNPYRIKVVEMEFEERALAKEDCEPFSLESSQIMLRGVVAIDFHSVAQQDILIFQPLPDALMEHLDLIKKPSMVQPSSFVDLLDNISANDSFTALPMNGQKQKETRLALQDLKSEIDFTIVRDERAQSIFEHAKDAPNQQQLQLSQQRKVRPQSGKPAQIRNRPISGISQNNPQFGQRSSINPSVQSQVAFGTGYKESKHQRPHSGGIFRSFGSQQKTNMNSNTTAAGTNSCLNIDVNTFNHPHVYSSRKSNELQFAKKNYVVIKKTATLQGNSRPKSAQRKVTQRFQPVVQEEVPSFDIPYLDDGVLKSSVNSQKVFNFKSQSRKALRAKKLSKQEDDFLNMMLKNKIFSQKLSAGIHSGRVGQQKTQSPGKYVSTATSQSERPIFHMQPRAVLPKPLINNLGIQ